MSRCINNDVLWCILQMNVNMFEYDHALLTTLATPCVCRDWRIYMLGVPAIWVHLIDLDFLHRRRVNLRREIICRSGTKVLWIIARGCARRYTAYITSAMSKHWGRIQRLEVNIAIEYMNASHWQLLDLSAPYLESLKLTHFELRPPFLTCPLLSPFGGSAPMVREFCLGK